MLLSEKKKWQHLATTLKGEKPGNLPIFTPYFLKHFTVLNGCVSPHTTKPFFGVYR
jgi:hypothetical protein